MVTIGRMSSNNNNGPEYSENNYETNSVISNNANNDKHLIIDLASALRAGTVKSFEQFAEDEGMLFEEAMEYESVFRRTPIIVSAMEGYPELVAYLIEKRARLDHRDSKGNTALMYACEKGEEEIVEMLLQGGATIRTKNSEGADALWLATASGNANILYLLLEAGSDPNSSDGNGYTALMNAAEFDASGDSVQLLLEKGANPDVIVYARTALTIAFEHGNKRAILQLLPKTKRFPAVVFEYALEYMEKMEDREIITHFPEGEWETYVKSLNAYEMLKSGIEYGRTFIASVLLKYITTSPTMLQDLLGIALNSSYRQPLIINSLIKRGADVNGRNANMDTPLHMAAKKGDIEMVKFLLEKGADKLIKNRYGKTAIHETHSKAIKQILSPPWKGFDRSDLEVFVGSFDLEVTDQMGREGRKASAYSFSVCPVCLEIRPREEGCDYMDHNCNESEGKDVLFPTNVYETYKCTDASLDRKLGKIFWCVICNRICENHKHFRLGKMEEAKPSTVNVQITDHAQHFVDDCRSIGGGGVREKVARFAAFRKEAIVLQPLVGTISEYEAKERLAKDFWDAPLIPGALEEADRIIADQHFFDSLDVFPSTANVLRAEAPVENVANAPEIPYPGATGPPEDNFPTVTDYDDDKNVVELNHKNKDGTVIHHKHDTYEAFELPEFMNYVRTTTTESERATGAQFGFCPFKPCEARLYPQEITKALELAKDVSAEDRAQYEAILLAYKKRFNKKFRHAGGKRRTTVRQSKNRKTRRGPSHTKKRTTRKHA